ncbi:WD40 repeat domain-containing protein [Verrucomicrobia bacterium]|nr:WD40 repeat domain-containing protein [Verrucomicrobiota bacterium]
MAPLLQPLSAAEAEPAIAKPVAWHASNADVRAPVKVDVKGALLRMPPQVYLADLTPLETTAGLAFDPLSKKAMQTDVRDPKEKAATIATLKQAELKPQHFLSVAAWEAYKKKSANAYGGLTEKEGGPMLRLKGSVTVALKPEYKFFTWRGRSGTKVFIDGKEVRPEHNFARYWQEGKIDWQEGKIDIQEGAEVVGHNAQFADHQSALVSIPSGAKTLKFEVTPSPHTTNVGQAGFITRHPKVARATICFPGLDPVRLIPVVYRANGERVGCCVVWASKSMPIMFDSSSGDEDYWVYLLDEAKKPVPLDWTPQAEVMEEARQLERYNPELETLAGFEKLWGSAEIVGRGVPKSRAVAGHATRTGWLRPSRVMHSFSPTFGKTGSEPVTMHEVVGAQSATLRRISGTFHIPATDTYTFFCLAGPGGYVLLDGHLVASFRDGSSTPGSGSGRILNLKIEKGQHRIELLQYGPTGHAGWAGLWWKNPSLKDLNGDHLIGYRKFGQSNAGTRGNYVVWEPLADAVTAPLEHRANASSASFNWYPLAHQGGLYPNIGYPKYALNWYRFSAHAPGASADAVYRWRFDDGRRAEGKQIRKLFLRGGTRKVELEVLDAPGGKVIARAAGEVAVHMSLDDWADGNVMNTSGQNRLTGAWVYDVKQPSFNPLLAQIWEFAEEGRLEQLPVDDLVNYYEWLNAASIRNGFDEGTLDSATWKRPTTEHRGVPLVSRIQIFDDAVKKHSDARKRSGDVLAARADDLIAAYPYSELLRIAQNLSRTERGPSRAHYAAAEKLLAAVLERAPAGSSQWRTAALALSDIVLSVRGDTESALALLEKFQRTKPAVDMVDSWQFAEAREGRPIGDNDKLAALTAELEWSPIERPRHRIGYELNHMEEHQTYQPVNGRTSLQKMLSDGWDIPFKNNRGFWLARDFDLPADWEGSQLIFKAGTPIKTQHWQKDQTDHVWINGEPLGRMRQWPDQNIVIPAKLLNKGGKNRITWLFQPNPWSNLGALASPIVLASDLRYRVATYGGRLKIEKAGSPLVVTENYEIVYPIYDAARSLAFSPDGKQLASGYQYGSVRLWDLEETLAVKEHNTAFPAQTIRIGDVALVSLAWSPDGKRLAVGSADYRITLLDLINRKVLRSYVGHDGEVTALAFSPDGTRLASASHDRTVKVWDASSGKELLTLAGHSGPVEAVAYSADGKSIASAIDKTHIRLWDASTGKTLRTLDSRVAPVDDIVVETHNYIPYLDEFSEGMPGRVLSLAFSPDGKRLASGSQEGFINQWDLASGKKQTLVPRRSVYDTDDRALKAMYSHDGKELISVHTGRGYAQKWDSETGQGGERFALLGTGRFKSVSWLPPGKGPDRPAIGFENYPVGLYTTKDCEEPGMTVASYAGRWEKLPDFDALKPVKEGVVRHIDQEHLSGTTWQLDPQGGLVQGTRFKGGRPHLMSIAEEHLSDALLPYWKSGKKEDGSDQWTAQPSGMKASGYLKVEKAGDYEFSLHSYENLSQLVVGSETVVHNDGKGKKVTHGKVHLEPGVHPVTLTFLNARQQRNPQRRQHENARGLHVGFPEAFVRSLTAGDIAGIRLMAGALLAEGKREEAKDLLIKLHRGAWPLSERDQEYVEQSRMRIRRMAGASANDRSHALALIESSLVTWPMLRLDPEFMVSVIAVYANLGDPRATILADQMLKAEMHDGQRRILIMTQVKIKLNEGDLPGAGQVYQKLKKLAPQSEETIAARELIKAAVIKKRD